MGSIFVSLKYVFLQKLMIISITYVLAESLFQEMSDVAKKLDLVFGNGLSKLLLGETNTLFISLATNQIFYPLVAMSLFVSQYAYM